MQRAPSASGCQRVQPVSLFAKENELCPMTGGLQSLMQYFNRKPAFGCAGNDSLSSSDQPSSSHGGSACPFHFRLLVFFFCALAAAAQNCTMLLSGVQDTVSTSPDMVGSALLGTGTGTTVFFPTKSSGSVRAALVAVHIPSSNNSVTTMDIGDTGPKLMFCGFGCQAVYLMFERYLSTGATCSPGLASQAMFARFDARGMPASSPIMDARCSLPYGFSTYSPFRPSRVGVLSLDGPSYAMLPRLAAGSTAGSINVVRLAALGVNESLVSSLGLLQLATNTTAVAVLPLDPFQLAAAVTLDASTGYYAVNALDISAIVAGGNATTANGTSVVASIPLDPAATKWTHADASSNGTLAVALLYPSGATQVFIVAAAQPAPGVGSLTVIGSFTLGETASVARLLTNTIRLRFSSDGTVVAVTGSLATCLSSSCVPQVAMARLPLLPDGSISAANGTINATQSMVATYPYATGCNAVAPLLAPLLQAGGTIDGAAVIVYGSGSMAPPLFDIYRLPINSTQRPGLVSSIALDPPSMSWSGSMALQSAAQPAYAYAAVSTGSIAQLSLGPKPSLLRSRLVEGRRRVNMTSSQGGLRVATLPGVVLAFVFRAPSAFSIQAYSDLDLTPIAATVLSGVTDPATSPLYDPATNVMFWSSRLATTFSIGGGVSCVYFRTYRVLVNVTVSGRSIAYSFTQLPRFDTYQRILCAGANDVVDPAWSRDGDGNPVMLHGCNNGTDSTLAAVTVLGPNAGTQPVNFSQADDAYIRVLRALVGLPDAKAFFVAGSPVSASTTLQIWRIDTTTWTGTVSSAPAINAVAELDGAALFSGSDLVEPTLLMSFNSARNPVWVNASSGGILAFTRAAAPIAGQARGFVSPSARVVFASLTTTEPAFIYSSTIVIPPALVASASSTPSVSASVSASTSTSASTTASASASGTASGTPSLSASQTPSASISAGNGSSSGGSGASGAGDASELPTVPSGSPLAAAPEDSIVVVAAAAAGGGGAALLALIVAGCCLIAWRRRYCAARSRALLRYRRDAGRSLARVSVTERALLLTEPHAPSASPDGPTTDDAVRGAIAAMLIAPSNLCDVLAMAMPVSPSPGPTEDKAASTGAAGKGAPSGGRRLADERTRLQRVGRDGSASAAQLMNRAVAMAAAALDADGVVSPAAGDDAPLRTGGAQSSATSAVTVTVKRVSRPLFDDAELQHAHRDAAAAIRSRVPLSVRKSAIDAGLRAFQGAMDRHRRETAASSVAAARKRATREETAAVEQPDARTVIASALDAAADAVQHTISAALSADDFSSLVASAGNACAAFSDLWDEKSLEAEADLPDEAAAPLASQLDAIAAVIGGSDDEQLRLVSASPAGITANRGETRRHGVRVRAQAASAESADHRVHRVRIGLTALKASVDERLHSRQVARKAVAFARSGATASQLARLATGSAALRVPTSRRIDNDDEDSASARGHRDIAAATAVRASVIAASPRQEAGVSESGLAVVELAARPLPARAGSGSDADRARCVVRMISITAVSALASRVVHEMQRAIQAEDQAAAALFGATAAAVATAPSGCPAAVTAARLGLPKSAIRNVLQGASVPGLARADTSRSADSSSDVKDSDAVASDQALASFSLLLCAASASADAAAAVSARAAAGGCCTMRAHRGNLISQVPNRRGRHSTADAARVSPDGGALPLTANPLHAGSSSNSRAHSTGAEGETGLQPWAASMSSVSPQLAAHVSAAVTLAGDSQPSREHSLSTGDAAGALAATSGGTGRRASFGPLAWQPVVPRSLKAATAVAAAVRQGDGRPAAAPSKVATVVAIGGRPSSRASRAGGSGAAVALPRPSLAGGMEQEPKGGSARRIAARLSTAADRGGLQLTPVRSRSRLLPSSRQAHPASPIA